MTFLYICTSYSRKDSTMKHIITLLISLLVVCAANAQTDPKQISDQMRDNPGISIAGFDISIGNDEASESGKKVKKPKIKRVTTNFAGISFGGNVLSYMPNYGNWEGMGNFLTDNTANWRFGLEAMGVEVSLDRRRNFFFKTSLSITRDIYRFLDPITLINDEDGTLMPADIYGNVKKSKMVANYLGIGAGFGFMLSQLKITLDFNTDILTNSYVKYKNPDKVRYKINGLNNIRYRAGISATLHDFGFYADYSFVPLFREGVGNDGRVLSIGVRAGF